VDRNIGGRFEPKVDDRLVHSKAFRLIPVKHKRPRRVCTRQEFVESHIEVRLRASLRDSAQPAQWYSNRARAKEKRRCLRQGELVGQQVGGVGDDLVDVGKEPGRLRRRSAVHFAGVTN
jgi:hypothetical protein